MPAQTVLEEYWLQDKLSLVCLTSPLPSSDWGWLKKVKDTAHGGPNPIALPLPGTTPYLTPCMQRPAVCTYPGASSSLSHARVYVSI